MKVILKARERNLEIEKFFMEKIFPILNFGIAIEFSDSLITVYEKMPDGSNKKYKDYTVEVIVELLPEVIILAKDSSVSEELLHEKSGEFFDEAMAIRMLEESKRSFSIEYYSCSYSQPN